MCWIMNDFGNYQYCYGIYGINITLGANNVWMAKKTKQKQDKNKKFPLAVIYICVWNLLTFYRFRLRPPGNESPYVVVKKINLFEFWGFFLKKNLIFFFNQVIIKKSFDPCRVFKWGKYNLKCHMSYH